MKISEYEESKNFTYLNQLINTGQFEIKLDHDIVLEEKEEEKFPEGIIIDYFFLAIDGNGHTIDAQGRTRIFKNMGKYMTIKNVKLQNGYAKEGGAIYNHEGTITIEESVLENNTTKFSGGAIYNNGKSIISDTTLQKNTSIGKRAFYGNRCGGAINNAGILTLTNTTLRKNTAIEGGAIHNYFGTATIQDTLLQENRAVMEGGAIHNYDELILENTIITQNTAKYGGTIWTENQEDIKLKSCTMEDNKPEDIYSENNS